MVLELYGLQAYATGGAEPWLSKWYAAAAMPVMVFFGAIYRFYANEVRGRDLADSNDKDNREWSQIFVGAGSYLASCALFGVVVAGITHPILSEACPPANATATCPITDPLRKSDADALLVFTFVWLGYPAVSLIARFVPGLRPPSHGFPTSAASSVFKDVAYGSLDATSKGALAIYVCYRTTWIL